MALINTIDRGLSGYVQKLPDSVRPYMSAATLIGEPVVVVSIALFSALIAKRQYQHQVAIAFMLTIAGSTLNGLMKMFLHRTRPDTLYVTRMRFKSYSFPSGHAFGSLIAYGLVGYLAFQHLNSPLNYLALSLFSTLIFLVGVSRVYLGAHFPTDVIGGWLLASICLYLIVNVVLPI